MDTIFTLCNDRQNRRNGINPTSKNSVACNEAATSLVNQKNLSRRSQIVSLLIAFCLLFGGNVCGQETLIVADGTTTNSNVPMYGLWADAYLRCQTIYPAGDLTDMNGGTISSLTYYLSSTATADWTGTWTIKMMETSASALSAFIDMTNATTVYTGQLSATSSPMVITLNTPYSYTGGNLIIEVNETTKGNYKSATFYGVSSTSSSWQGYNSSSWDEITGSTQGFIPKTTFTYTPCTTSRSLSFANCPTSVGIGSAINCTPLPSIGSGYGTITYTSSNTDVAIVDANTGLVTGVSAGNATITATISTANGYCSATATHNVYVIPTPQIEISSISGNNFTLTASITESFPSGYSYHWYSDEACTQEISGASGTNNANLTYSPSCEQRVYCRLQKNTTETQVANFGFSGETVQTYTVPAGATSINMEVWGAQGGGSHDNGAFYPDRGGKGGYSKGTFSTQAGQTLYVCVGGRGKDGIINSSSTTPNADGGYNGGGKGAPDGHDDETGGGGGGATHVAKAAPSSGSDYQLRNYSLNKDDILIVAGGGGGSSCQAPGGYGGGNTGGNAYYGSNPPTWTQGASNAAANQRVGLGGPAATSNSGNFGYGEDGQNTSVGNGSGGGGGGYYGGYRATATTSGRRNSGGGGSGYLKNTLSSSQTIAGSSSFTAPESGNETGHPGNGYARITASSVKVVGAAHSIIMKTSPSVTNIIAPDAVCYGGSISIIPPEITENGAPITSSGWEIASTESDTYSGISQIGSGDADKYVRFVATNECGSVRSNAVQIANMKPSPSVSSITDAVTAYCGDYITLEATPSSGNISWYRDANCTNELSSANVLSLGKLTANATYYATANENFDLESVEEYGSEVFEYTGSVQSYTIPEGTAAVKLEVWGAQGGYRSDSNYGGKGGYSVGTLINLSNISTLYVCVGGAGGNSSTNSNNVNEGGYNGGGYRYGYKGGGGATHIATATGLLKDFSSNRDKVLIVAGGGGSDGGTTKYGYYGGGSAGGSGNQTNSETINGSSVYSYSADYTHCAQGGTQEYSGYSADYTITTQATSGLTSNTKDNYCGGFGFGGGGVYLSDGFGGAGGGGWYGGAGNVPDGSVDDDRGGGGGSGYVNTTLLESGAQTIAGNVTNGMPTHDGTGSMTGNEGNGYARITLYRHKTITCASSVQTAQITINQMPAPTVQDITICEGTTGQLNVQSPLGSDITYSWNEESPIASESFTTVTLNETTSYRLVANKIVPDDPNNIYNFDYTGNVQEVVVPSGATYAIMEVWGAQGGESWGNEGAAHSYGGKGGYASGKLTVTEGQHLYVVVGGKGSNAVLSTASNNAHVTAQGGYNGGGGGTCDKEGPSASDREASGAGGGATHIAIAAPSSGSDYQLRYYSSNQSDILLVAGGGGGASYDHSGGYGGGGTAGASASGKGTSHSGTFGLGADGSGEGYGDGVAGGGGGWTGGGSYCAKAVNGEPASYAGGGTGYANTSALSNYQLISGDNPYMPNPSGGTMTGKEGNGYARIVFYGNSTSGSCVSVEKTVNVNVDKKPEAPTQISASQSDICNGSSTTLSASGGSDGTSCRYEWGIGETEGINTIEGSASSIAVSPSYTTKYWVRKVGTSACKDPTEGFVLSSPVTVNSIVPNITGATTICSSGATLTATGGSQYKWNGDSDFSNVASKNITEAGTYTVTVKSGNCTASTSRVVTVKETPSVSMNSYITPVDCGTQVTLSATSGQTISWYSDSDCTASASPTFTPTADAVTRYAKVSTDYTGIIDTINYDTPGMYEFTVPSDVDYVILETWGAQGGASKTDGHSNDFGGKGGYAKGKLSSVSAGDHLYVVVGGKGGDAELGNGNIAITAMGGYNGGGGGTCDDEPNNEGHEGREASGAGGGATHIATAAPTSGDYQLRYYSSTADQAKILLVAGGGGGASYTASGGCGGGTAAGASATAGTVFSGGFGYGAHANGMGDNDGVAGGGGGWLGGNSRSTDDHTPSFAGGGTGYVNESSLTDRELTAGDDPMPNPAGGTMTGRTGNGYARITVHRSNALTCASTVSAMVEVTSASVELNTISVDPILICAGTTKELTASTSSIHGVPSYSWTPTDGLSADNENATISAAGTYTYNVTATLNNNDACKAADSKNVTVSYKTPSSEDIEAMGGIADGNVLWTGNSTDWNGTNNWMQYTAASGTYTLTSAPTSSSNVVVGKYSDCVTGTPILNLNTPANVDTLKIGSGVTVSGENAVNLYGNLVNGGTFDAPVNFAGTTKLRGEGSTTIRNITINPGRSFNADDKSLSISGNWTNNGTFSSTGTVTFAGGATQTIGGSSATAFNNVTFSNENGIEISTTPTINGTANFSNGVVSGNVTFGSSASAINASKDSYVDGLVTKSGSANGFTFPTGDNGNLGTVKVTSAASDVSVQYFGKAAGFSTSDLPRWWNVADMCGDDQFNHISNIEYWKISSVSEFTANFTADAGSDMHFNSNPENDRDPDNVQMAFFGSNCWTNIGGSTSIDGNKITMTGVTIPENTTRDISGNYIAPASKNPSTVLPIELLSFSATCNGRYAELAWSTATERNNDYFVIERSDDAMNFTEVGRVAGAGNSIEQLDYTYNDYGIHGGDNYYRLVQVDYDGTRTVSDIVVATCIDPELGEPDVQAYPNPFNGELTLVLDNFGNRAAIIEVYDMLGKLVFMQKADAPQNSYETVLNLSNLPPAAYTVRVSTTDFVTNRNVVKQ